ncbi:SDR family oxidoreductase [Kordiimonas laminariae]|uniref:SDR family oxidoreductase n=1 Tax=Kordiimonas laminariae TaxID=2917717 RepID=UPI001FF4970F|nr:SDR family oxidoreductase [Kordiimonas laminariae]MCK0070109.1 SDR family oxidoreductase [Kordiimonas laminariae]
MSEHWKRNVAGKTVLITGAGRGIGAATARYFAKGGANLLLVGKSPANIERLAEEINAGGGKALAVQCDVAKFDDVQRAVDTCLAEFGSLDVLINNAGIIDPIATLEESDPAAWGYAGDVNYKGVYHGIKVAIGPMKKQRGGIIINLSSGAANSILEGWSHYCSNKAASKKLTEIANQELGRYGIRVIGISPGTVATDMMHSIKASAINPVSRLDWNSHIPVDWVAKAIAFLCGDEGQLYVGTDFSIKTPEGRALVGLPEHV